MDKFLREQLIKKYSNIFNTSEYDYLGFSPGRVNLLGEHIDYVGGNVLVHALNLGIYGVFKGNLSGKIRVYSEGFSKEISIIDIKSIKKKEGTSFVNYIKGCIQILSNHCKDIEILGFDLFIYSTLSAGSGLSSSAALEMLILKYLDVSLGLELSNDVLQKLGNKVENEYLGLNSGIMDQTAVLSSVKDYVLAFNIYKNEINKIQINLPNSVFFLVDTKIKRQLVTSDYNNRVDECLEILKVAKTINPNIKVLKDLLQLNEKDVDKLKHSLDGILLKRYNHLVNENNRALKGKIYLENGEEQHFYDSINASHLSLANDYQISLPLIEEIRNKILDCGVNSARIMGAGFGGCLLCCTSKSAKPINKVFESIYSSFSDDKYPDISIYEIESSDGTYLEKPRSRKYDIL